MPLQRMRQAGIIPILDGLGKLAFSVGCISPDVAAAQGHILQEEAKSNPYGWELPMPTLFDSASALIPPTPSLICASSANEQKKPPLGGGFGL